MAGLLIKELIARGDLERCLIVCPRLDKLSRDEEVQQKLLVVPGLGGGGDEPPARGHRGGAGRSAASPRLEPSRGQGPLAGDEHRRRHLLYVRG